MDITQEQEATFKRNLLRDYDRLIHQFTEGLPRCGEQLVMFFTYDELLLILGALKASRPSN